MGEADVVWEGGHGYYDGEIKVQGGVLPGGALAAQRRRQHMKKTEKKRLDSVCRALSYIISTFVAYTISRLIKCCLDGATYGLYYGNNGDFCLGQDGCTSH